MLKNIFINIITFVYVININNIIIFSYNNNFNNFNNAVIVAPVVDVSGESLSDKYDLYSKFEYAPESGKFSCLRLHQLLFNELIRVIKETDKEVFCEFSSLFYYDDNDNIRNTFWLPKHHIKYLDNIDKKDLKAIPKPYRLNHGSNQVYNYNILTLKAPWQDLITNKVYSAGTRFVRAIKYDKKEYSDFYSVFLLDDNLKKTVSYVSKKLAVVNYGYDINSSINLFLSVLQQFIYDNNKSIIPYLWGGCSYIDRFESNLFYLKKFHYLGYKNKAWTRFGIHPNNYIKTGLECSSVILRAAQIAGLPYFAKNSQAIYNTLEPIKQTEKIENGDILWYPGHVLIVSDVDKNLIIESVGYPLYYGKLHELKLNQIFKDINNYAELLSIYLNKGSIKRLNQFGQVFKKINNFSILKFDSILKL